MTKKAIMKAGTSGKPPERIILRENKSVLKQFDDLRWKDDGEDMVLIRNATLLECKYIITQAIKEIEKEVLTRKEHRGCDWAKGRNAGLLKAIRILGQADTSKPRYSNRVGQAGMGKRKELPDGKNSHEVEPQYSPEKILEIREKPRSCVR